MARSGSWIRSKILGSYRFQVISARPVAPLAADRAIRQLGAGAGQDGARIGVVALEAAAHVIGADVPALVKRRSPGPAVKACPVVTSQPTLLDRTRAGTRKTRSSWSWPTRVMPRSPEPKA